MLHPRSLGTGGASPPATRVDLLRGVEMELLSDAALKPWQSERRPRLRSMLSGRTLVGNRLHVERNAVREGAYRRYLTERISQLFVLFPDDHDAPDSVSRMFRHKILIHPTHVPKNLTHNRISRLPFLEFNNNEFLLVAVDCEQIAEEMFRGTPLSIKQVVSAIGLSDRSHFSRDFKTSYGVTPKEFIAQHRTYSRSAGFRPSKSSH